MKNDTCNEILKVENLLRAFRENIKDLGDQIFSCFYNCCYDKFIKWAIIKYDKCPEDVVTDLSDRAFTDGMLKLQEFTVKKGLYKSTAGVNKIFFRFFRNQLRANITKERRLIKKNESLTKDLSETTMLDDPEEFSEVKKQNHECLEQSLNQMKEGDRDIVRWRHMDELSNKDIAKRLGITIPSATNRIYRCMEQLRNLMDKCKQNNDEDKP